MQTFSDSELLASKALALAFELNTTEFYDGAPCRMAFELARLILAQDYEDKPATLAVELLIQRGNLHTPADISQAIDDALEMVVNND